MRRKAAAYKNDADAGKKGGRGMERKQVGMQVIKAMTGVRVAGGIDEWR